MAILRGSGGRRKMSPFRAGLLAIVLVAVASYFAFTQANPFADPYQFEATFETANNLKPDSPVRIAGVEVGVVKQVLPIEGGTGAARVMMEMNEDGLPIHEDAELKIRPRIFLEGNEFVDVQPGTPSAPVLDDGGVIPVNQTATPVQLGEVLTALQSDTREDLRTIFAEYGTKTLQGGGAEAFNDAIEYWEPAYKNTALASEALHGTQEGDLQNVIRGQQRTFAALSRSPETLQNLVTDFNITAAAFAREDDALQATVPALRDVLAVGRPALQSLNSTLPGVRRFAVDALPGVRSSGPTIEAAFPFIHQTRLLFSKAELRGLVDDLRPTIPALARVNRTTIPLLNENRALSRCQNQVLLKWANDTNWTDAGTDAEQSGEKPFKQFPRSLTGLSGESRIHDGASPMFRLLALGGVETVLNVSESEGLIAGFTSFTPRATQPEVPLRPNREIALPQHRPDVPCENQEPPNLHATIGQPDFSIRIPPSLLELLPQSSSTSIQGRDERTLDKFMDEALKKGDLSLDDEGNVVEESGASSDETAPDEPGAAGADGASAEPPPEDGG